MTLSLLSRCGPIWVAAATVTKSGPLPSGVSFVDNNDGTATLAGTPAVGTGGSYPLTITASNGIDPDDVQQLVKLNTEGRLRLVDGDNVEIIPGIRVYVGSRHTFASEYLRVDGKQPYVLASDNVYFYRNLSEHKASATFSDADHAANIKAQERMIQLAGSVDRVVPGHDALQFKKYPTQGRVAKIQ